MLRSPASSILSRFRAGGVRLKLAWYGFMLTAVLLALLARVAGQSDFDDDPTLITPAADAVAAFLQEPALTR